MNSARETVHANCIVQWTVQLACTVREKQEFLAFHYLRFRRKNHVGLMNSKSLFFYYQTAVNCVLIKTQPQPRKQAVSIFLGIRLKTWVKDNLSSNYLTCSNWVLHLLIVRIESPTHPTLDQSTQPWFIANDMFNRHVKSLFLPGLAKKIPAQNLAYKRIHFRIYIKSHSHVNKLLITKKRKQIRNLCRNLASRVT